MDEDEKPEGYDLSDLNKMMETQSGVPEGIEAASRRIIGENKGSTFFAQEAEGGHVIGIALGKPEDKDPWKSMVTDFKSRKRTMEEFVSGYIAPTLHYRSQNHEGGVGVPKEKYRDFAVYCMHAATRYVMTMGRRAEITEAIRQGMASRSPEITKCLEFVTYKGRRTGLHFANTIDIEDTTMGPGLLLDTQNTKGEFDELLDDVTENALQMCIHFVGKLRGKKRRDVETAWKTAQMHAGHTIYEKMEDTTGPHMDFIVYSMAIALAASLITCYGTDTRVIFNMASHGHIGAIEIGLLLARRAKARGLEVWEGENKLWKWSEGCDILLQHNHTTIDEWRDFLNETPEAERNDHFKMPSFTMSWMDEEITQQMSSLMHRRYLSHVLDMEPALLTQRLSYYGLTLEIPEEMDVDHPLQRAITLGDAYEILWRDMPSDCPHMQQLAFVLAGAVGTAHYIVRRKTEEKN